MTSYSLVLLSQYRLIQAGLLSKPHMIASSWKLDLTQTHEIECIGHV